MPRIEVRPAIASSPLSLVLIARPPDTALTDMLADWRKVLDKRKQPYEIILVDERSAEATETVADLPDVQLIRLSERTGFGAALRAGIAAARHPLLCYCTGDRQYDPADLNKMLEAIDKVDLVTGFRVWQQAPRWLRIAGLLWRAVSRAALGIPLERPPGWLGWSGFWRRKLLRWVFGVYVGDPECAFRLARRETVADLPLQSDGTFVHAELLAKANFVEAYLVEVPVAYRPPAPGPIAALGVGRPAWRDIRRVFSRPRFRKEAAPVVPAPPTQELSVSSEN